MSVAAPPPARSRREPTGLDAAARATFGLLARIRGARALHPIGVAHVGRVTITADRTRLPSAAIFQDPEPARVLVRLSRGAGTRPPLPDAIGLAIRWPDRYGLRRHHDLLLTSSADAPLANHVPVPRRQLGGTWLSSLLPFDVCGRRLLFGARIEAGGVAEGERATEGERLVGLRCTLLLGTRWGRFHPVGEIELLEPLSVAADRELHFNPWNTGPDITPVGWWNRLRAPAYRGSQRGRGYQL
jgi:hypothetical protein